ncbi:MAG: hypothetical protein ACI88C_000049 [Acidimicrobiales bacterium]|jgi:hypothetical protein
MRESGLDDIATAVLLGVATHPPLVSLRTAWRGGAAGPGMDITSGPIPQFVVSHETLEGRLGEYDITQAMCPCFFVAKTSLTPEKDENTRYVVEVAAIMPSMLLGRRLTESDIETFSELVASGLLAPRDLANTSIPSRLLAAGIGSTIKNYSVMRLAVDGTDQQSRVVAEVSFKLTPRVLLGRPIDLGN